jgi:hypothetical protein
MNNPFGPTVLNPVLDRLLESRAAKCYIVYINPLHRRECFDTRPQLRYKAEEPEYAVDGHRRRGNVSMADLSGCTHRVGKDDL